MSISSNIVFGGNEHQSVLSLLRHSSEHLKGKEDQTESIRPRVKCRTLGGKFSLEEKILHSPFPGKEQLKPEAGKFLFCII